MLWLGLGKPGAVAPGFCSIWLCPQEFSDQRTNALLQQTAGGKSPKAVAELKRAVVLEPASAYRWANLGEAFFHTGDSQSADYAFQHAVAAGPKNPAILLRAANFYFSVGDPSKMLTFLSSILRDPGAIEYYAPVFLTYTRAGLPVRQILGTGIPEARLPAQAFLRYLIEGNDVQGAIETWKWISLKKLYDDTLIGEYLEFLIRNKQAEQAAQTWAALNANVMPAYRRTNWVYNGGFETDPRPAPLDWHIEGSAEVQAERVGEAAHDGRWALQLAFNGTENVSYRGVGQQTVLGPGRWHVQAFIKTDGITTDQGVGLRIGDVESEALTGTRDWTKVEATFSIAPGATEAVKLEIVRDASRKFDNKISGTAWIDSIEITPIR